MGIEEGLILVGVVAAIALGVWGACRQGRTGNSGGTASPRIGGC